MEKSFKELLKHEIIRLRSTAEKELSSIITSREDFRLLAKEISEHKNGFEDTIITVDGIHIWSSRNMPFEKGIRFEPIRH